MRVTVTKSGVARMVEINEEGTIESLFKTF